MAENILIVDDEKPVRQLLEKILKKAGYHCTQAANAADARRCLEDQIFDLILSDIVMPGESGIDFIRYVSKGYPDIAAIMVTGIDNIQKADEALRAGVFGYIIKPFDEAQILISVHNALRQRQLKIENRQYLENLEKKIQERTDDLRESGKQLKEAHVKATRLLASITSIIIALDLEDKIVEWNRCAEKSFGLTRDTVIGKKLSECPIGWETEKVLREIGLCKTSGQRGTLDDVRLTQQNKKERLLGISFNPVLGVSGKIRGVLIYASDITKRRHLESQLAQALKLESIGQLAAGIAHEINTPTQYVGDNTRFLQEAFEDMDRAFKSYGQLFEAVKKNAVTDNIIQEVEKVIRETDLVYLIEEVPTAIGQTLEGVERVSKIVRSMKEFSHPGVDERTSVDINKALESTITVARNEWKYVADMKTDFDPGMPLVSCSPGELNQVFLNIIINAAHAISDVVDNGSGKKGIIKINTRSNGHSVEIRISDTGGGIPEKIQPRIFDPFFTTKQVGKGTGQGLAISHSVIVEKHGGSMGFETKMGKGTTFIIQLPVLSEGM
ncbi:MAG: response regulator [Deltaproteobacteria bacterium]|nr:response regulator [Deltaproteobacteria bacterium]